MALVLANYIGVVFGAGGIRTPGTLAGHNSLAGSPIRPLSHRSSVKKTFHALPGAGGIRTPGTLRHNGFQDRLLQPLGHRSIYLAPNGLFQSDFSLYEKPFSCQEQY